MKTALLRAQQDGTGQLPASGLPMRGRTSGRQAGRTPEQGAEEHDVLRVLSHDQLMALVSTRIYQRRMRHWYGEARAQQNGTRPMDARLALFAGKAARHPAWAMGASGAFCALHETAPAVRHTEFALDNKNEQPVYLSGSNNRKENPVEPHNQGASPRDFSAHPVGVSTTDII